jgi:acetylornithine deacetylase
MAPPAETDAAGPGAAIDPAAVQALLGDLVAIESVNPAYPGGERGEAAVAAFVADHCRRLGLDVWRQAVLPGRENVLARLECPGAKRTLLLEAHMDTVSLDPSGPNGGGGTAPHIRDGRLYGRGACDTKGALAAMLTALDALRARRAELGMHVLLLAAVDEEYRFRGVLRFVEALREQVGDAPLAGAIVGEPTALRVVVAHKGCLRTRIHTLGRAAHSSRPETGVNAIDAMAGVLAALGTYRDSLAGRRHPLTGSPTLSVGKIWGGTAVNIVPDRCTVELDRRLIPGEDAAGALAELDALLAGLQRAQPDLVYERDEPSVADWSLDTPPHAAVVVAIGAACAAAGLDGAPAGVSYGSDASKLWALARVPSVVFGPGDIAQAHTADEFVPLDELPRAAAVYAGAARRLARALAAETAGPGGRGGRAEPRA